MEKLEHLTAHLLSYKMDEIYIVGIRAKVVFALNTQTNRIQWLCLLFACLYIYLRSNVFLHFIFTSYTI